MRCHSVRKLSVVVQRVKYAVERISCRRASPSNRATFAHFRVGSVAQVKQCKALVCASVQQVVHASALAEVRGSFQGGCPLRVIRTPTPHVCKAEMTTSATPFSRSTHDLE